ncbi:MAG: hypothetical protein ACTS2F_21685 [Thainema sp.]
MISIDLARSHFSRRVLLSKAVTHRPTDQQCSLQDLRSRFNSITYHHDSKFSDCNLRLNSRSIVLVPPVNACCTSRGIISAIAKSGKALKLILW